MRDVRDIDAGKRSLHLRLRALRLLGIRRDRPKVTPATGKVLFICYGNIMRSPMSAALLAQHAAARGARVVVRSAGTNARGGRAAEPRAVVAAAAHGIALAGHAATLVTDEAMRWADVVFAMDHRNEADLVHRFPWAEDKVALLGAFALAGHGDESIPDPYSEDEATLEQCYDRLAVAVEAVARQLAGEAGRP